MVCLLNSCLYVMFRSCFESLASVVPIKLVRAAHCGAPRIAVRRAFRHTVCTWAVVGKNDWQFSNPRIDTAVPLGLIGTINYRCAMHTGPGDRSVNYCSILPVAHG